MSEAGVSPNDEDGTLGHVGQLDQFPEIAEEVVRDYDKDKTPPPRF